MRHTHDLPSAQDIEHVNQELFFDVLYELAAPDHVVRLSERLGWKWLREVVQHETR